jgi:hypothetical protein
MAFDPNEERNQHFYYNNQNSMFIALLREAFLDVYASDSYDIASDKFNSEAVIYGHLHTYSNNVINTYRDNPLVMLTSFFGLSNYYEGEECAYFSMYDEPPFTTEQLKKNVFGSVSGFFKNLISVIVTTPQSIVKLFTEFLPRFAVRGLFYLGHVCVEKDYKLTAAFLLFLALPFKALHLLSRAVTSPIESVRNAWFYWVPAGRRKTFTGVMLGLVFATASILITMTVYALLFSLIAPSLGLGAAQLAFMTPEASSAFAFIGSKIMLPMLLKAGAAISPVVAGFTTILGAGLGFVLGTVGPVVNDIYHWCQRKLREPEKTYVDYDVDAHLNADADATELMKAELEQSRLARESQLDRENPIEDNLAPETFHAEPGTTANTGLFSESEKDRKKRTNACAEVMKKIRQIENPQQQTAARQLATDCFVGKGDFKGDFAELERVHVAPILKAQSSLGVRK